MGQLTEFFMKSAGGPPPNMGFSMPMMKGWVPRRIQPWLYVLTAFCFQFSGGIYLGALDGIRGTTNFMIEDVPTGGGLFHCRNGQNTRNVRVYEQHPTLDHSQTRFCSLLPCTPHYLAHGD